MCKECDGKIVLLVGKIDGIVSVIKDQQTTLQKTVTDNRVAAQKDFRHLSKDITNLKIKVYGVGAVFGSITGFLSRYIPS